ncbi:MAG: MFS transporter [Bacteroidales bacterium]|nr:MFS transporter [Bacteroidales bacterium]
MSEKVYKLMNDNPVARWSALILIALMMFFGYMFVDVMSPLQSLIEVERGWTPSVFGTYAAGEYILNVCGFLILAGIILDKMGIRFTGTLSASMMLLGAVIKFIGISDFFQETAFCQWLGSWWTTMPGSAKMAAFGFMIFGCGCEMAGITVSRSIAKWFEGKEMALAMGLEMAIARVGVFAIFSISPLLAESLGHSVFGKTTVVAPVAFCTVLLCIGLIFFLVFCVMDRKFDAQLGKGKGTEVNPEDEFKISDIGKIFSSRIFWVIALLCVLYYSAIFPFQRYGANMLQCNLDGISPQTAANIFRWFPIGAAVITPFLGAYLDNKGKGATMLIFGALLLIVCHLVFAFVLPATHSRIIAYVTIVILGVSFALVPAALWPSVPKVMNPRYLGSAYSLIFWVQNIGLCFVPMLIGSVLQSSNASNPAVIAAKQAIEAGATDTFIPYNYTVPLIIFASFGVVALLIAIYLKAIDKKNNYGLEEPNIKK